MTTKFEITEQHIKLSKRMYVGYDSYNEFGAPRIEPKRPYGNSCVIEDMSEILGLPSPDFEEGGAYTDEQEELLMKLHKEMATVIQIGLVVGYFKEGSYVNDFSYGNKWRLVK